MSEESRMTHILLGGGGVESRDRTAVTELVESASCAAVRAAEAVAVAGCESAVGVAGEVATRRGSADMCELGKRQSGGCEAHSVRFDGSEVPLEVREAAAEADVAGKHEPGLREGGIPADVLERLLPGDDVIVLDEPKVAGGLGYRFAKRAFDACAAGVALAVLAVPMAAVAVRIKLESPGPAIYAQERVGMGGRPFKVYKFRSMYADAEARGAQWATGDDPRVTPFGRVMRRTRLAPVIIGTPGAGELVRSLSSSAKTPIYLHKHERHLGFAFGVANHYTSSEKLSVAVFGDFSDSRTSFAEASAHHGCIHALARVSTPRGMSSKKLGAVA